MQIFLSSFGCTVAGKLLLFTFCACAHIYYLSLLRLLILHSTTLSFLLFVKIVFKWNQELVVSRSFQYLTPAGAYPNVPDNVPTWKAPKRWYITYNSTWSADDLGSIEILFSPKCHFSIIPSTYFLRTLITYCTLNCSIHFVPFVTYVIMYSCNIIHTSKFFRCLQ